MTSNFEIACSNITGYFILLTLLALVGWTYYLIVTVVIARTFGYISVKIIIGIIYHVLLLMMEWSHLRAVFCKKNHPPSMDFSINTFPYNTQQENVDSVSFCEDRIKNIEKRIVQTYNIQQRMSDGSIRICQKCKIIKPDRCHHCSYCKKCILKMDHHCPWVNNCLGFYNYKYFILYLTYTVLYCLFSFSLSLVIILDKQLFKNFSSATSQSFQIYILCIISIAFMIGVLFLLLYHYGLIFKNKTTLGKSNCYLTLEESRASNFVDGIKLNAYDYGKMKNWEQVFGPNPLLWFIPIFTSIGDGLQFTCAEGRYNSPLQYY